jgi:hypothetical protein
MKRLVFTLFLVLIAGGAFAQGYNWSGSDADTFIPLAQKAAASGVATLNSSSKVVQEPASKGAASGIASLDSNSLVVQNPANATATPTASKLAIADNNGKLDGWITPTAKAQMISSVYGIIGVANIKAFWIFDQTGAVTAITDRSGNAHTVTLGDASLTPINASTCSPGTVGLLPYLAFDATHVWNTPDHNDFTFIEPQAFSVFVLANITATDSSLFGKANVDTTGEYLMYVVNDALTVKLYKSDFTAVLGRATPSIATQYGTWHTYGFSYSGVAVETNIKIYNNGAQTDNATASTGSYTTMSNTPSLPGDYFWQSAAPASMLKGKESVVIVCSVALTPAQMIQLDYILRGYAGSGF